MSREVHNLLLQLCREARDKGTQYVFSQDGGEKLARHMVDNAFRRACQSAEISGFRFHDLRHEYGSRLGDSDVNLKKIARLMGHSTTKQTEQYVHPEESGLLAATEIASRKQTVRRTTIVPEGLREAG